MITKFKLYEEINNAPKVDDYIISNLKIDAGEMQKLNNLIGKCSKILEKEYKLDEYIYVVYYIIPDKLISENILKIHGDLNGNKYKINLALFEIEYCSKDKEDLEMILATKDFNL